MLKKPEERSNPTYKTVPLLTDPVAVSKKKIIIWAGWAISLFFIVWAFMSMDMAKVWDAMKMADYRWVIPAVVFNLAQLVFRAQRWTHFIAPIKPVSLRTNIGRSGEHRV